MEHNMDADNVYGNQYWYGTTPNFSVTHLAFKSLWYSMNAEKKTIFQMKVTYRKKNSGLRSLQICESHKGILVVVAITVGKKNYNKCQ